MTTRMTRVPISNRFAWTMAAALLLVAPGHAATTEGYQDGAPLADERASYSFLRTIQGDATIASNGEGVGGALEANQPLLTGDLVRVGPGSRLEIALSDRNRLYLDAETGVSLERIAFSGDREERVTVLRLEGGELLLLVSEEALGDELPSIITANATVYIQQPGEYRVEAGIENNGESWTRVVTRSGYAEIVTESGSSVVREGESMLAQGDQRVRLQLAAAGDPDVLEGWTAELTGRALAPSRSAQYVEPQLAYDAAPLDDAGNWVEYQSVRYWRPYVSAGWRPYTQGRWGWTPSGYTWISYEPWGWVPYHYGRWCSLPGYGWAWRPGAVYSPAWVYWNWTSGYAAWVPMGYYSHFYDPWYGGGFRYGVYGWAGGGWGIYSDWNFAPIHCFRDRNFRGHIRSGRDFQHESRLTEPPRGLLTTDTRDFRPDRLDRTDRTEDLLHQIGKRNRADIDKDLPDVTDFVDRKGKLPADVARRIVRDDPKDPGVIQDIGRLPKVAQTPDWKKQDPTRSGDLKDRSGFKEPPAVTVGKGGPADRDRSTGADGSKPGATVPKLDRPARVPGNVPGNVPAKVPVDNAKASGPQAKIPVHDAKPAGPQTKAPVAESKPAAPRTKVPTYDSRTSVPQAKSPVYESRSALPAAKPREIGTPDVARPALPGGSANRQQWKAKGGENAPVQRVVGSVRRPTPGSPSSEPGAPPSGGSKGSGAYVPTAPSTGKGTSASQPYRPSGGYGKGSSAPGGAQDSRGSSGYSKAPQTTSRSSQGSSGPGKGAEVRTQSPQGGSSYGKVPSTARRDSQGSTTYGKGSSGGASSPQGAPSYGKGPSSAPSSPQRSSSYGKGSSSGSSSSQGSSSYGKSPASGPSNPQRSSSYGKSPSTGSSSPQSSSSYGKSPGSGGSSAQGASSHGRSSSGSTSSGGGGSARGSQSPGKGSAASSDSRGSGGKSSSSSKGQSSSPPPESKSDDGGH